MGLLDDAIKEHLDLKRRRGADPDEISRQETEALGPVRRGEVDLAVRPTPVERPEVDEVQSPEVPEDDDALAVAPEPEGVEEDLPAPQRSRLEETGGQPTRQFSAVESDEAQGARRDPDVIAGDDADPDVLEETPEFLEETPEHDRLWFEQKPPKDFDF